MRISDWSSDVCSSDLAGVELENEDSWWWFKRNSERVFNDAKTAADRKTEVTVVWNRWRSQLFSWHPNIIDFGPAGAWPLWQLRVLTFYAFTGVGWVCYFWAFTWLHRRTDRSEEHTSELPSLMRTSYAVFCLK